jgi:hypothetical protein
MAKKKRPSDSAGIIEYLNTSVDENTPADGQLTSHLTLLDIGAVFVVVPQPTQIPLILFSRPPASPSFSIPALSCVGPGC